jgi:hypothetical protein
MAKRAEFLAQRSREASNNIKGMTHHANVNRMIAKAIICAQSSSDTGKDIDELKSRTSLMRTAKNQGYRTKSFYILDAIKRINGSPRRTAFTYYVEDASQKFLLVYFNTRVNNQRAQISFHVPKREAAFYGLIDYVGKGVKTRWDKDLGGSRRTAQYLIDYYRL